MICHRPDVSLSGQPSSSASICVLDCSFLPRRGGITEPGLCPNLGLKMRPTDELCATIECDRRARSRCSAKLLCSKALTHPPSARTSGGEPYHPDGLRCSTYDEIWVSAVYLRGAACATYGGSVDTATVLLFFNALVGLQVTIYRVLTDTLFRAIIDYPVAYPLWRPAFFQTGDDRLTQLSIFDLEERWRA